MAYLGVVVLHEPDNVSLRSDDGDRQDISMCVLRNSRVKRHVFSSTGRGDCPSTFFWVIRTSRGLTCVCARLLHSIHDLAVHDVLLNSLPNS